MGPAEYEGHVADILESEGWSTEITPFTRDFGVDVLARRGTVSLAVQAKMYGGSSRRINPATVMELYGAARYADCDRAMVATDGELLPDARLVAKKLGIEVRHFPRPIETQVSSNVPAPPTGPSLAFDEIWTTQIKSLEGRVLASQEGKSNIVESVDDAGLIRISSNGRRQRIDIEVFRWAIERLLAGEVVTRAEINDRYPKRASSGIVLVLSSIPNFRLKTSSKRLALELAPPERPVP